MNSFIKMYWAFIMNNEEEKEDTHLLYFDLGVTYPTTMKPSLIRHCSRLMHHHCNLFKKRSLMRTFFKKK